MGLLRGEPRKGSTSATARQKKRERQKRDRRERFRDVQRRYGGRGDEVKWRQGDEEELRQR